MAHPSTQRQFKFPKPTSGTAMILYFILFLLLVPSIHTIMFSPELISWQRFETELLERKAVEKIIVYNKETARIFIKKEFVSDSASRKSLNIPSTTGPHFLMIIGSVESFERKLEQAQNNVTAAERIELLYEEKSDWNSLLKWIIPLMLFFLAYNILVSAWAKSKGGSSFNSFGRTTARLLENEDKSTVSFDQVAGLEEAKQEVKEIIDFLKSPQRYTNLGAKIPKGVIIVGPPGTGKTLLAKAVAGEAQVPFFSLSGSEFVEMFVGVGASRVRDLFKRAKEKAPCIVFIDEIDAIGRSRGRNAYYSGANDERESTLDQLLTEMDGFGTNTGVIVLAATNRADILDPALLRPGRFDRHIYLELPNLAERNSVFKVHLSPLRLANNVEIDALALQTPGFSGADIANICNEAALIAARKQKEAVDNADFFDALDRIVAGFEKKNKIITAEEKRIIAYHEAGHAIISWLLEQIDPLMKVSIIPHGKSLGAAWYLPEERQVRTYTYFVQRLIATLGGRAAEEVMFNEVSTGAIDDLEKVTRDAYGMVAYFGFNSQIGNISFYDSTGRSDMAIQKPYSEDTGRRIDEEVRKLVEDNYQQAKGILARHRDELVQLADLLLQKEVVHKKELEVILGKRGSQHMPTLSVVNSA